MSEEEFKLEKKKKKKTINLDDDGPELDLKKKKKPKKTKDGEGDAEAKKEKKEKKKKEKDGEGTPKSERKKKGGGPGDLDLTDKKKKNKKDEKKKKERVEKEKMTDRADQMGGATENAADFDYESLLDRVCLEMQSRGLGKGDKEQQRYTVPPPKMGRIGAKRTVYENFGETCNYFDRELVHVRTYILNELGANGNLTEKGGLVMKGRFSSAQMEKILRPYIKEYILCKTCKSPKTKLSKTDRLTFMECQDCSSKSTVIVCKAGFSAVIGRRKKIKEQQGGQSLLDAQTKK